MSTDSQKASSRSRLRVLWVVLWVLLLVVGLLDVTRRARLDPLDPSRHMTDLTVYTEAGAAFFDGRDPYVVSNVRGWTYLYPPLFAILLAPMHPLDTRLQAAIWFLISCGFGYGMVLEVRRVLRYIVDKGLLGRRHGGAPPSWIIGPASFVTVLASLAVLQRGQADLALCYPLWLGLRLAWIGGGWPAWLLGGMLLAAPVSVKLTPALAVGFLLLQLALLAACGRPEARPRALAVSSGLVAGMALWLLVVPSLFVGWQGNLRHLASWRDHVVRVVAADQAPGGMDRRSYRNQSLHNAAYRMGNYVAYRLGRGPDDRLASDSRPGLVMPMDQPAFLRILGWVRGALVLVLLIAGLRLTLRSESGALAGFGLACSATLIVSPVSWPYHYVLWLPALLFVPLWLHSEGRDRAAAVMAWIPCGLAVVHGGLLSVAGRLGILGLGHTAWFIAASALTMWKGAPPAPEAKDRASDPARVE